MDPDSTEAHACVVAEVEVDTETGDVKVLSLGAPTRSAARSTPRWSRARSWAARVMGMAPRALRDDRAVLPAPDHRAGGFFEYLLPGPLTCPRWRASCSRYPSANGPYGVKGVGEMTANSPIPAIVNAINNAIGVRITELPVTPEKVLRGLEARQAGPSEPA